MDIPTVPEMLKRARRERALSKRKAAEVLGCSRLTYDTWEGGTYTPRAEWAKPLAAFCGVPEAVVLGAIGVLSEDQVEILVAHGTPTPPADAAGSLAASARPRYRKSAGPGARQLAPAVA